MRRRSLHLSYATLASFALLLSLLSVARVALAQDASNPDVQGFGQAILAAASQHAWGAVGALVVGLFVALCKQGWLGKWVDRKLPPKALPYFALALGVLGVTSAQYLAGVPLETAIVNGLLAALGSVFAHQTVVEGMRSGKEIVPPKKIVPEDSQRTLS